MRISNRSNGSQSRNRSRQIVLVTEKIGNSCKTPTGRNATLSHTCSDVYPVPSSTQLPPVDKSQHDRMILYQLCNLHNKQRSKLIAHGENALNTPRVPVDEGDHPLIPDVEPDPAYSSGFTDDSSYYDSSSSEIEVGDVVYNDMNTVDYFDDYVDSVEDFHHSSGVPPTILPADMSWAQLRQSLHSNIHAQGKENEFKENSVPSHFTLMRRTSLDFREWLYDLFRTKEGDLNLYGKLALAADLKRKEYFAELGVGEDSTVLLTLIKANFGKIISYIGSLASCTSVSTFVWSTCQFITGFYDGDAAALFGGDVLAFIYKFFDTEITPPEQKDAQSMSRFIELLKRLRSNVTDVLDFPIVAKFYKLLTYLFSSSLALTLGLQSFPCAEYFNKPQSFKHSSNKFDLGVCVADFVIDFLDGTYQFWITGNPRAYAHTGSSYTKWFEEINFLKQHMGSRTVNPGPGKVVELPLITYKEFNTRLCNAVKQGKEIARQKEIVDSLHSSRLVASSNRELDAMYTSIYREEKNGEHRDQPLAILLYGPPHIAKSQCCAGIVLACHSAMYPDCPYSDKMKYTRNAQSEYWDGFTNDVLYVILDDIGSVRADATNGVPGDIAEFIQLVNTMPFPLNMAHLDDKGSTHAAPDLVVGTTNTKDLDARFYFNVASAIGRRFSLVITVSIKPEFRKEDSDMLDTSKIPDDGEMMNVWAFDIERTVVSKSNDKGMSTTVYKSVLKTGSFKNMLTMCANEMIHHKRKCGQAARHTALMERSIKYCRGCKQLFCRCPVKIAQGLDVILTSGSNVIWSALYTAMLLWGCKAVFENCVIFYNRCVREVQRVEQRLQLLTDTTVLFHRIGSSIERRLASPYDKLKAYLPYFAVGVTALTSLMTARMLMTPSPVGHGDFVKIKADESTEGTVEVWKKTSYVRPEFAPTIKCITIEQLSKLVMNNSFFAIIEKDDVTRRACVLCLYNSYYVAVGHTIPEPPFSITLSHNRSAHINDGKKYIVGKTQFNRDTGRDVAVFHIVGGFLSKNIMKYIPEVPQLSQDRYFNSVLYDPSNKRVVKEVTRVEPSASYSISGVPFRPCYMYCLSYKYGMPGSCGSPLIMNLEKAGVILAGLHVLGAESPKCGAALPLERFWLERLLEFDSILPLNDGVAQGYDLTSFKSELAISPDFHPKSPYYYTQGCAVPIGEIVGHQVGRNTTDVRPTPIVESVNEIPLFKKYHGKFAKPNMKSGRIAGMYSNPYQATLAKIAGSTACFNPDLFEKASINFYQRVVDAVPDEEFVNLHILTGLEAVNGVDERRFVNKMPKNTGGGMPFGGKKVNFMRPTTDNPEKWEWLPEVQSYIDSLFDAMMEGQILRVLWLGHMKNEAVKLKPRIQADIDIIRAHCKDMSDSEINAYLEQDYDFVNFVPKLPRVFCGTPAPWSHNVRRLFLPLVAVVQRYNCAFECAVGINATGKGWGTLYEYIVYFGVDQIVAGDYSAYDKSIPAMALVYGFWVYISLLLKSPHMKPYEKAMWSVAYTTIHPVVVLRYLVVMLLNSLPSGHPLTTLLNSIVNSLLVRVAFMSGGFDIEDFNSAVHLMTYGDDNVMGVSKTCGFTHTILRTELGKCGITYTSTDKESVSPPLINISTTEFLKREWVVDGDQVRCPLALSSIYRMLTFRCDSVLSEPEHTSEILNAAQRELWQHGEQVYNEVGVYLKVIYEKYGVMGKYHEFSFWTKEIGDKYDATDIVPLVHTTDLECTASVLGAMRKNVWIVNIVSAILEEGIRHYDFRAAMIVMYLEIFLKPNLVCWTVLIHTTLMLLYLINPLLAPSCHLMWNLATDNRMIRVNNFGHYTCLCVWKYKFSLTIREARLMCSVCGLIWSCFVVPTLFHLNVSTPVYTVFNFMCGLLGVGLYEFYLS